ncbi:MAG: glycerol-3-phosphate 1-O-acyltransferase PlsY [Syntrophomonadaceae bacterium]
MKATVIILLSYIIGSISFSYIFSKVLKGHDIRKHGSGNLGATNVLRTTGLPAALLALGGDLLKGILGAFLGMMLGGESLAAACGLATVVGHCFPIFFGLRGGKGVATAAGVIIFLLPKIFIILAVTFAIVVMVTRYVSLASITAALLFPALNLVLLSSMPYILMSFAMSVLVVYRHRENIKRLRNGTELRVTDKVV